jgi:HEAT repeat protein
VVEVSPADVFVFLADAVSFLMRPWTRLDRGTAHWFTRELQEASAAQGLRFAPRSTRSSSATGTCEDFSVHLSLERKAAPPDQRQYPAHLCVAIFGPRIPQGIAFAPDRGTGDDVLTGDTAFDDMVEVRGEPSILLALLDREIRQRVGELVRFDGVLKAGQLMSWAPMTYSPGEVAGPLRLSLWLARELSSPGGGVCERLARNAKTDPHSGVRLWNLLQLHEQFPETKSAREASQEDLKDPSPWVRLAAARFLKAEGLQVLEHLARDRVVPESAAAEAVALLAARYPAAQAGPLLLTALKTHSGEARRQAVEELGRIRYVPARGALIVLLDTADPQTASTAAAALAGIGEATAEGPLLKAMESDARELRLASARALGTVGTAASVEPLLAFLGSRGLDAETRQAIRDAVAAIQSRLSGAGAGQLSLAATPAGSGWLSVPAPGAGEGQLSLAPDGKANTRHRP